jgi:hypothetical protein
MLQLGYVDYLMPDAARCGCQHFGALFDRLIQNLRRLATPEDSGSV